MNQPHAVLEKIENLRERVIIALDVSTVEAAAEIVHDLRGEVGAFKIGLQLFTAAGPSVVRHFTYQGLKIFLDLKFHDIPNTVAHAGVEAAKLGVWMFNIHAAGGDAMMRQTADSVKEACGKEGITRPLVIGVTALTSLNDPSLLAIGVSDTIDDYVVRLTKMAAAAGLDGVVASPHESKRLRQEIADPNFCLVTPGIRPVSATPDDQKRVTTGRDAFVNGSDYIVIGRSVVNAVDRRQALTELLDG